ncbi:MAG: ATP-dependent zinc metalloprotease FtsH [Chlamydiales bacterium]|nr:ATP-dependent zinc metalloprotease FtsH [Chlamydiales bacterium]MCH9634924.1 ATP-dependent zinc metalloprotease FtsH [Chlamydiales bacterium]
MANENNNRPDQKKGFPTTFFLLLLAMVLVIITVQNFMTTKRAKVSFSHQVEHLVNLDMIVPEDSRKVSLNDNLVTFSGRFKERESEEGKRRFKFLDQLDKNHQLTSQREDVTADLGRQRVKVEEAASWFLQISGQPVPAGGYRVVEGSFDVPGQNSGVVIQDLPKRDMVSLPMLEEQLRQINGQVASGHMVELSAFETELSALVDNFRSPILGIGSESMKQDLKTLSRDMADVSEPTVALSTKISTYEQVLARLSGIVAMLNRQTDGARLVELRSVRQYRDSLGEYSALSASLEQNSAQLDKSRSSVGNVIWYFNNKELSTKALERQDAEAYSHWFSGAKEEWTNFKYNHGLPFKAPDQPRNLVLERTFKSEEPAPNYFSYILTIMPIVLIVLLLYFVFSRQMKGMGGGAMQFGKSPAKMLNQGQNKITFKDVAGIEEAKEELVEIVDFLKNPMKFTALGGRIPKGVLLIGAPGTGKTLIAKAVAGEADRPFFTIAGSDFVEMFVGVGASRIRDMFEQAKKNAPCIIFIDEIDAVGRHRGAGVGGGHDEREQTLNQLLVEMDGFDTNEGVILMAATNRPDVLDKALLRPGRFDRNVVVSLPDIKGRYEILKVHARKIKIDPSVDLMAVARSTPGAAGADLANLLNESALLAARKGRTAVTGPDLAEARDKVLYGKERRSLELGEEEKRTTAYHESGHAVAGLVVDHSDPVDKVTIIPRGMSLGATHFLPVKNRVSYWKKEVLDQLVVLMGGRAAEEVFIHDISSGAQQDIAQATNLARNMVCKWGMSDDVGLVAYDERDGSEYSMQAADKAYSDETAQLIDKEVRKLLDEAYARAVHIVKERYDQVELMAQLLIEFETLDAQDVKDIVADKWDSDKKREKMAQEQEHFKRNPETPPPPPPKDSKKKPDSLGLDPA